MNTVRFIVSVLLLCILAVPIAMSGGCSYHFYRVYNCPVSVDDNSTATVLYHVFPNVNETMSWKEDIPLTLDLPIVP